MTSKVNWTNAGDGELIRGSHGLRIANSVLHGGRSEGVRMISMNNGKLELLLLPSRGMGIWKARGGFELGWRSPVPGPVHPSFVDLWRPDGIGWLAGFDELLVRCGLQSNGAPEFQNGRLVYPLHGKIANIPAHEVMVSAGDNISVTGVVDEAELFGQALRLTSTVTMVPSTSGFAVRDEVQNIGGTPAELELLYHINMGLPLLQPGAKLAMPIERLAPRDPSSRQGLDRRDTYGPPTAGVGEEAFFATLRSDANGWTQVMLQDPARSRAAVLRYMPGQLPCFTQWKLERDESSGYVTGLEPGTNWPNPRSFEKDKGRVITLQPGESRVFELSLELVEAQDQIAASQGMIDYITGRKASDIVPQPDPEWSKV